MKKPSYFLINNSKHLNLFPMKKGIQVQNHQKLHFQPKYLIKIIYKINKSQFLII
jgi:hypothetical protein